MAIQIGGTTVIDDSRNLDNIAGADATTVSNLQAAGLGASTTVGAVGTYTIGVFPSSTSDVEAGTSYSGSQIYRAGHYTNTSIVTSGYQDPLTVDVSLTLSGTWKTCERYNYPGNGSYARPVLLCIRVS
jgi:hypothetical protein